MRAGRIISMGDKEYRWLERAFQGAGFLAAFDRKLLAGVLPYVTLAEYPKASSVCREGEPGDSLFLIYSGAVEIQKKGWDAPVAVLRDGEFFGEDSLLFKEPRAATAVTVKPSRLFALRGPDFERVLSKTRSAAAVLRDASEARRRQLARA